MQRREHASSAKLPFCAVEDLREIKDADRDTFAAFAEQHGVHLETARRAYKGLTWQRPMVRKLDDETRYCKVCGTLYSRRQKDGRLLELRLWKKKRTCKRACYDALVKRQIYAKATRAEQRLRSNDAGRDAPIPAAGEADGRVPEDGKRGMESRPGGINETQDSSS